MNKKELDNFKKRLLTEKAGLEQQLSSVGKKDTDTAGGWDATSGSIEVDAADDNEVADKLEELDENATIANQLEGQLTEVKAALVRMEKGTYGTCEVCGKPIEMERLEANPSAKISIKHSH